MKTVITTLLVLAISCLSVVAQEKSNREIKGDKQYFVYAFDDAISSYEGTKELTTEGQRRLAESYCNINRNIESEMAYAKLVSMNGSIPEDYFKYAMVLKANGKYAESVTWMDKFASRAPNDLRAKDYLANRGILADSISHAADYTIHEQKINTEASDFGPAYYKDKIVFSTSRATPKLIARKYNWNDQPYLDIYIADVKDGQLEKPKSFSKNLNGKLHDGPVAFSNGETYIAYTRNNYDNERKDKIVECQIYFSSYADGKWSDEIAFPLNGQGYSVGHPFLTEDGNTLYFASDMPGGYGGVDIYRINKDTSGNWGTAENLGNKINTESDEMFPFVTEKTNVMFFASNGRYGIGGLDIFIYEMSNGNVYNAGAPLNTRYDDFAVIVSDDETKGYFSSNRSTGEGDDDLYAFDLLKKFESTKIIAGIAKDIRSNPVPNTFITIKNEDGSVRETLTTEEDGAYSFIVDANKQYEITGEKENYRKGSTWVNTNVPEQTIFADVVLLQEGEPVVDEAGGPIPIPDNSKIEEGQDLGQTFHLNNIYFDFDKYNIRPDAESDLKILVKVLNDNPNVRIMLTSHADCRGTRAYNQELSNKRSATTAWYLRQRITNPGRIQTSAKGETQDVSGCECEGTVISTCNEDQFQQDRRTEFKVVGTAPLP